MRPNLAASATTRHVEVVIARTVLGMSLTAVEASALSLDARMTKVLKYGSKESNLIFVRIYGGH